MKSVWTWMSCSEDKICADCQHMEAEGWTVISITQSSALSPYYKVFMRRVSE